MNALIALLERADRFLDGCHHRTIATVLLIAIGAWIANLCREAQYSTIIEVAFTVDWILAGIGLGVLAHVLTRNGPKEIRS